MLKLYCFTTLEYHKPLQRLIAQEYVAVLLKLVSQVFEE